MYYVHKRTRENEVPIGSAHSISWNSWCLQRASSRDLEVYISLRSDKRVFIFDATAWCWEYIAILFCLAVIAGTFSVMKKLTRLEVDTFRRCYVLVCVTLYTWKWWFTWTELFKKATLFYNGSLSYLTFQSMVRAYLSF